MKLPPAQTERFLKSPPPAARAALLYGPDAGLVRERGEALARAVVPDIADPFSVSLLDGSDAAADAHRLYAEMSSTPFGGGKRLVWLRHAADANAAGVEEVLKDFPKADSFLLVEAGDLGSRSKLRLAYENCGEEACAVACYVEDTAQRQRSIAAMLAAENLSASRDVLAMLADMLPPDRIAMRSEMEKLAMYAKGKKEISEDDARAVLLDAGAAELDDLMNSLAMGNAARAMQLFDRLMQERFSVVAILRMAQSHMLRLQLARSYLDGGAGAEEAVKKLRPPVFWKNVAPMAAQVKRWPENRIEAFLKRLYETEAAVKKTGSPAETLCAQLFLKAAG